MFKNIRLGSLAGVPIDLHWTLVVALSFFVGLAVKDHGWVEGGSVALTSFGIFSSILAHEYGHVFAARRVGIQTVGILLTPLGGLAKMDRPAVNPNHQILISLAGPVVSLILVAVFASLEIFFFAGKGNRIDFISMLVVVNFLLFAFNMLPIFPMDGGQILHGLMKKFIRREYADRISMRTSQAFAVALAGVGYWYSTYSLILIALLAFVFASLHFDSPWTIKLMGKYASKTASEARFIDENETSHGIFVAFDGEGQDFAYARHWKDFDDPDLQKDQKDTIAAYTKRALELGGEVRLLNGDEFDRLRHRLAEAV